MRLVAFLFLFFGVCSLVSAQDKPVDLPVDPITHLITYSGVVERPGVSKTELYALSKQWFSAFFSIPNGESVSFDEAAGTMEGIQHRYYRNSIEGSAMTSTIILWYTVRAAVKDGQYSYVINQFRLAKYGENPTPFLPAGPIEAFILTHPANRMLRDLIEQQRKHVKGAAENFLENYNYDMKSKP
ncbi:DUF4468 domain-containing protein [Hymenobacter sp. BRD67]|uniref:DUF4468 domain-containing protein n=1 Tax=Hymenobacter sp. BRD67 TaxID=2675877 RepID=UPI00156387B0|nr:DUF4468 domain-containing protein [Hymenobacter sp. BRD67]QKG54997.1 DUF4468 domain-containing protein [Hymenobacter sp. BRD67]